MMIICSALVTHTAPGWLIDLSRNTRLRSLVIELEYLSPHADDLDWVLQILSRVVSVHIAHVTVRIACWASYAGPYGLDWPAIDAILMQPQFANLKQLTVTTGGGIPWLQRPTFPQWLRAQLPQCQARRILFVIVDY